MTTSIHPNLRLSGLPAAQTSDDEPSDIATQAMDGGSAHTNVLLPPGDWYLTDGDDIYTFLFTGFDDQRATIHALAGNDHIELFGGIATLYGGLGNDYLLASGAGALLDGGDDNDTLVTTGGHSTLIGGNGNDNLSAVNTAAGPNVLDGGVGDDTLTVSGLGTATLIGGDDNDTISGGDGDDQLDGGYGYDTLIGGAGNDLLTGGAGGGFIDGGEGFDTLDYADGTTVGPVVVNLADQTQNAGGAAGDFIVNVEKFQLSGVNDVFVGSNGNDTVDGLTGDDIISGGEGDDTLFGGRGLHGGRGNPPTSGGNDTLLGGGGNDSLDGGDGDDTLDGGAGSDNISGGIGNDTIVIHANEVAVGEIIDGGDDIDTLVVADNNMHPHATISNMEKLFLNSGVQTVFFTSEQLADFDTITHQDGSGVAFSITAETAGTYSLAGKTITGILTLNGSSGADTLIGSSGNDILSGKGGADIIQAGDGNDTILINANEVPVGETIDGGSGIDKLVVGDNNMRPRAVISNMEELDLASGVQEVFLTSAQLADFDTITHLDGSGAAFSITAQDAGTYSLAGKTITGILTLNGSSGADTLIGSSGNDILSGKGGADIIQAGDGDDTILIGSGEAPPGESIDGGAGFDRLLVSDPNTDLSVVTITNVEEIVLGSGVNAVTLSGAQLADIERITRADGGGQALVINAAVAGTYSLADKTVTGIVTLNGSSGADTLIGSSGADTLNGNAGNDVLDGGAGADALNGGDGTDTASYRDATAAVGIDLTKASSTWTGDALGDVFSSIEQIELSEFADVFRGDANANTVRGGAGNDQLFGAGGDDVLEGGSGDDTIQGGDGNDGVHGNLGDDYLQGNAGDDVLYGEGGNDRMVGGIGNDTLVGGLGGDYLVGNEGADIFRYTAVEESQNVVINGVSQQDQIVDFTQGQDKIDLSAIDSNPTLAGDQAFVFIADPAHYTGDWTGVVWETTAANGIVTLNVSIDGDAAPEMTIYMSHPYQLTANDFIL